MALIHVDDGHWRIISLVPTMPNGNKVLFDCPYVFAKVNGSCPDYDLCGPFSSLAHLLDIVSQNGEHFPTTGVICLHFLQKYKNGGILENFVTLSVCKVGNSLPDDTMVKRYVSGPSSYWSSILDQSTGPRWHEKSNQPKNTRNSILFTFRTKFPWKTWKCVNFLRRISSPTPSTFKNPTPIPCLKRKKKSLLFGPHCAPQNIRPFSWLRLHSMNSWNFKEIEVENLRCRPFLEKNGKRPRS